MDYQELLNNLQDKDVINLIVKRRADRYKETDEAIIFFNYLPHNANID